MQVKYPHQPLTIVNGDLVFLKNDIVTEMFVLAQSDHNLDLETIYKLSNQTLFDMVDFVQFAELIGCKVDDVIGYIGRSNSASHRGIDEDLKHHISKTQPNTNHSVNLVQPVVMDQYGTIRFKENRIVSLISNLCWAKGFDPNYIAYRETVDPVFNRKNISQLNQLVGYSVCGYADLSTSFPEVIAEADRIAAELLRNKTPIDTRTL